VHGVQPVFVTPIAFLRMIDVAYQSYSSGSGRIAEAELLNLLKLTCNRLPVSQYLFTFAA
jgi:hypothetical protein